MATHPANLTEEKLWAALTAAEERLERLLRSRDEHAPGDWYAASAAFQRLYDEHCARIRSAAREGNHGPHRDPRNLALIERGVARASRSSPPSRARSRRRRRRCRFLPARATVPPPVGAVRVGARVFVTGGAVRGRPPQAGSHCKNGHPWTEATETERASYYLWMGWPMCRKCRAEWIERRLTEHWKRADARRAIREAEWDAAHGLRTGTGRPPETPESDPETVSPGTVTSSKRLCQREPR